MIVKVKSILYKIDCEWLVDSAKSFYTWVHDLFSHIFGLWDLQIDISRVACILHKPLNKDWDFICPFAYYWYVIILALTWLSKLRTKDLLWYVEPHA